MSNQSLLATQREANQLLEVGPNQVSILRQGDGPQAIGSPNLRGNACIVVVGQTAIILANIDFLPATLANHASPSTVSAEELSQARREHYQSFIDSINQYIRLNAIFFLNACPVFAVSPAGAQGQPLMEDLDHQVEAGLPAGYVHRALYYPYFRDSEGGLLSFEDSPPRGELVVSLADGHPVLFWEDARKWARENDPTEPTAEPQENQGGNQGAPIPPLIAVAAAANLHEQQGAQFARAEPGPAGAQATPSEALPRGNVPFTRGSAADLFHPPTMPGYARTTDRARRTASVLRAAVRRGYQAMGLPVAEADIDLERRFYERRQNSPFSTTTESIFYQAAADTFVARGIREEQAKLMLDQVLFNHLLQVPDYPERAI